MSILFNGILWEKKMGRYVDNVNNYMAQMKIRQKYVSIKSGIDEKKLSRILKGGQKITGDEMEKIAYALGRNTEYFISEDFKVTRQHGEFIHKGNILFMGTFHPAALLRNPNNKPDALSDFQNLRDKIKELNIEI